MFFPLLDQKSGGLVGRFLKKNLGVEEMQYYSCVCILGHAEPQN